MKPIHPQRLSNKASPGTLLKRAHDLAQRRKLREVTGRDPVYLSLVRQCPCLKCGLDGFSEAAHVRMNSGAHGKHNGLGKKAADRFALPLCAGCHRQDNDSQHRIGENEFWHRVGLNPLLVCEKLYAKRSDVIAMRAAIFTAIAERESLSQMGHGQAGITARSTQADD
jgi:hypothetical protein